ncbi:hypothetical protein C7475_107181 [Chitinophaga sp. S165]|nr:hypothetical protein C7475_107181 [Chitinophaga sp. S165]
MQLSFVEIIRCLVSLPVNNNYISYTKYRFAIQLINALCWTNAGKIITALGHLLVSC